MGQALTQTLSLAHNPSCKESGQAEYTMFCHHLSIRIFLCTVLYLQDQDLIQAMNCSGVMHARQCATAARDLFWALVCLSLKREVMHGFAADGVDLSIPFFLTHSRFFKEGNLYEAARAAETIPAEIATHFDAL